MNWLAIIVVTTNIHHTQYMVRIPVPTKAACEAAVVQREAGYVSSGKYASASDWYECVDIGAIVSGAK